MLKRSGFGKSNSVTSFQQAEVLGSKDLIDEFRTQELFEGAGQHGLSGRWLVSSKHLPDEHLPWLVRLQDLTGEDHTKVFELE